MTAKTIVSLFATLALGVSLATSSCDAVLKAKVKINSASLEDIKCLPGVGDKIAKNIIAGRPFKNGKDLEQRIKGIGATKWKKIAQYITFKR